MQNFDVKDSSSIDIVEISKNIAKFKNFSNYLKQKNTILPIVNSGQAPSSLFINKTTNYVYLENGNIVLLKTQSNDYISFIEIIKVFLSMLNMILQIDKL